MHCFHRSILLLQSRHAFRPDHVCSFPNQNITDGHLLLAALMPVSSFQLFVIKLFPPDVLSRDVRFTGWKPYYRDEDCIENLLLRLPNVIRWFENLINCFRIGNVGFTTQYGGFRISYVWIENVFRWFAIWIHSLQIWINYFRNLKCWLQILICWLQYVVHKNWYYCSTIWMFAFLIEYPGLRHWYDLWMYHIVFSLW